MFDNRLLCKSAPLAMAGVQSGMNCLIQRGILTILLSLLLLMGCQEQPETPQHTFVIGLITNNPNGLRNVQGFREEMSRLGYEEGKRVRYEYSGKPTPEAELDAALQSFLNVPVDLIFTAGTPTGVAAHRVTKDASVPVVFGVIADPVRAGVIDDLTQPGGNMTGVKLSQNQAKRLEIFAGVLPAGKRILVPYNPTDSAPSSAVSQLTGIAASIGVELVTAQAKNNDEVTVLLADLPDVEGIFMVPDSTVNRRVQDILDLAEQRRIPVSGPSVAQVEAGALMTYGFIHKSAGAQAARMADRILRGSSPATTPVETADIFLQVNLASAQRIGIQLSDDLLQRADVILHADKRGNP